MFLINFCNSFFFFSDVGIMGLIKKKKILVDFGVQTIEWRRKFWQSLKMKEWGGKIVK